MTEAIKATLDEQDRNPATMHNYKLLGWLTIIYIAFQLISDVTAGKIIQLGIFTVSVTVLYFPVTYIIADILTEVYGYAVARKVVWYVFAASVIAGLVYWLVSVIPAAPGFEGNDAYVRVLGQVPRILIGGWVAVWAGGILNDYVLAKMKIWTKGKHLWARTIGSTIVGEGANTVLFYVIALSGVIPAGLLIASILSAWFLKTALEAVLTPLTYYVVDKVKKVEGIDVYDTDTDFNPFKLSEK